MGSGRANSADGGVPHSPVPSLRLPPANARRPNANDAQPSPRITTTKSVDDCGHGGDGRGHQTRRTRTLEPASWMPSHYSGGQRAASDDAGCHDKCLECRSLDHARRCTTAGYNATSLAAAHAASVLEFAVAQRIRTGREQIRASRSRAGAFESHRQKRGAPPLRTDGHPRAPLRRRRGQWRPPVRWRRRDRASVSAWRPPRRRGVGAPLTSFVVDV